MKFNFPSLFITAFGFSSPINHVNAQEEEVIHGIKVIIYPVDEVLERMVKPISDEGIPAHLQYIIGLDQSGAVVEGTGLPLADPEYGVTLSAGNMNGGVQNFNRCYGGAWSLFYTDSIENGRLTATGKDFLDTISNDPDKEADCQLTFTWNDDFTEAEITGYFKSLFNSDIIEFVATTLTSFTMELQPYWRWKFDGLQNEPTRKPFSFSFEPFDTSELVKMDSKCCPQADTNCSGENVLGKEGPCETISKACGAIDEADLDACVFFRRQNYALNVLIPGFKGYNIYPLMDKYEEKTSYNEYYENAIKKNGVETIFHGLEVVNDEQ